MAGHRRGGGTVFRPKGRTIWRYSYFVNGRRITESSGSTDEAEAHRQLQVKLGEKASGKAVPPSRATIGDLCALVMDNHRMRELRRTKVVEYVLNAHILKALGRLPASRFGSFQIKAYIQQRQAEGASNATVNRELAIVGRAFKLGYEAEPKLVFQLPVIHKLPESNPRQGFLEPDQYETLLGELPANLKALLVCGYHTGARKGELRSIQWPQVDFAAGLIRLPAGQTKNKHPRTLPIYGDMRCWLEHQRETCPKECLWVFHGSPSGQIDTHLNGWTDACKRAGVPDLLFHDLRRSAVRNMKKAGLQDLEAIAHQRAPDPKRLRPLQHHRRGRLGRGREAAGGVRSEAEAGTGGAVAAGEVTPGRVRCPTDRRSQGRLWGPGIRQEEIQANIGNPW